MPTARERNQLDRINERLEFFRKGKISLQVLIADLEFLLSELSSLTLVPVQKMRESWEVLEEVYSFAQAEARSSLGAEDEQLVHRAVDEIQKLNLSLLDLPRNQQD